MEKQETKKISNATKSKQKADLYLASSLCDGVEDNNLKQVTTLLKNKEADPNVLMPLHGITPFHLVIGNDSETFAEEVTKLFLRYGGNPNVKSVDGMTPVHVAAAWGRTNILQLLLANGGDPLCHDCDDCTPFHYAFQGEHYEAISVLSKYCSKEEEKEEDEDIKYKLELDKVLVNNGEVIAEYMVSDHSLLSSSYKSISSGSNNTKKYKSSSSGYSPESGSTETNSIKSDFITVRRSRRKRVAEEKTNNIQKNNEKDNYNFCRDTSKEELELLNEIISQMSNSLTSDKDSGINTNRNYEEECLVSYKTSSPKRLQMTMTFNRPTKCNYKYANQNNKNLNRNNTSNKTLDIIKQHNYVPHLKSNRGPTTTSEKTSSITNKNIISKSHLPTLGKKVISNQSKPGALIKESQVYSNAFDETIISKSPNLNININSRQRNKQSLKTHLLEKKAKAIKKSSPIRSTKLKSRSPTNSIKGSISRIPKPKKYFITPCNKKTVRRSSTTPSRKFQKSKIDTTRRLSRSSRAYCSPLNVTYSKSESSTLSSSSDARGAVERRKSLKDVAVNLTNRLQANDENEQSFDSSRSSNHKVNATPNKVPIISELVSGVVPLDLAGLSDSNYSDVGSVIRESSAGLDQAVLGSITSAASYDALVERKHDDAKESNRCAFDSMLCQQGSITSLSSDSFISVSSANDEAIDKDNEYNHREEKIKLEWSLDESLSSSKKISSESFFSVEEEYKYKDPEEGVVFLERRLCVTPSYASSDMNSSFHTVSTARSEPLPAELFLLDSIALRERLRSLGENPGPITDTTHHVYLKRLYKLESGARRSAVQRNNAANNGIPSRPISSPSHERAILRPSLLSIDWIHRLDEYEDMERHVFQEFASPQPSRKWREGTSKSSFNYLLLDPRLTRDLPRRAASLSPVDKWQIFLSSIFYVGKGKRSRPYAHLYDAFKRWTDRDVHTRPDNGKIRRIMDIWDEGKGVVVLHVFHNTIPVEAYTREAAMIEVLGPSKLCNCKSGDYYGVVATWRSREKCELGRYLLYKAMQILLLEGERQIFPDNL